MGDVLYRSASGLSETVLGILCPLRLSDCTRTCSTGPWDYASAELLGELLPVSDGSVTLNVTLGRQSGPDKCDVNL